MPGPHAFSPFLVLTAQQRRRRSVYFNPATTLPVRPDSQRFSTMMVTASEIQSWVNRELQAIMLEDDVNLVCQVVFGTVTNLANSLYSRGTRYFVVYKLLVCLLGIFVPCIACSVELSGFVNYCSGAQVPIHGSFWEGVPQAPLG